MNDIWMVGFFVLLGLAMAIALYPIRTFRRLSVCLALAMLLSAAWLYSHWGGAQAFIHYKHEMIQQQRAQAFLKTIHSTDELIDKLSAKLTYSRESAQGWFLLGKLYASKQQWQKAADAFAFAYPFLPESDELVVYYVHSLWQLNAQKHQDSIKHLLKRVLDRNPRQVDALSMRAMLYYEDQDYPKARELWQRALSLVPKESEAANTIRRSIAATAKASNAR